MKMIKQSALFLSFALALAACGGNGGQEAETGEAQEVVAIEAAEAFSIDTAQSEVLWNGRKPAGEHHGTIAIQDGTIQLKEGEVVGGTINIDLTQIDVLDLEGEDEQKLAGHLQSPDFFNVQEYPTAKFVITKVEDFSGNAVSEENQPEDIENNGEFDQFVLENPTHQVTGNLTMRDTTLSITIPAKIEVQDNMVKATSRFAIDRSKWNVNYMDESDAIAAAKDKFIYNKVNVGFDVVASKE